MHLTMATTRHLLFMTVLVLLATLHFKVTAVPQTSSTVTKQPPGKTAVPPPPPPMRPRLPESIEPTEQGTSLSRKATGSKTAATPGTAASPGASVPATSPGASSGTPGAPGAPLSSVTATSPASTDSVSATGSASASKGTASNTVTPRVPGETPAPAPAAGSNGPPRLVFPKIGKALCSRTCARKEVLHKDNRVNFQIFAKAFVKLSQLYEGDKTFLEILVDEHLSNKDKAHSHHVFLPWHRYYLARLEQTLQTIDERVCLPFWDWSQRPKEFWKDEIFKPDYYGSSTTGGRAPIPDGTFANLRANPKSKKLVERIFKRKSDNQDVILSSFMTCYEFISQADSFEKFHELFSGIPHVGPHEFTGGDMETMGAPVDPLFWGHHAMLDLFWARYQNKSTPKTDRKIDYPTPNDLIPYYNIPVKDLMNTTDLCYYYDHDHDSLKPDFENAVRPTSVSEETLERFVGPDVKTITEVAKKAIDISQTKFKRKEAPRLVFLSSKSALHSGASSTKPLFLVAASLLIVLHFSSTFFLGSFLL